MGDYKQRHLRRSKVTSSLNGWQPVQKQLTHNLFGVGKDVSDGKMNWVSKFEEGGDMKEPMVEENLPADLTSNKVKPLSLGGIQEVLSHVSLYYNNCSHKVKFIVSAMSIKLKQLVSEGVKNITTMTIDAQNATQDSVMLVTQTIISQYQSAFVPKTGAFGLSGSTRLNVCVPNTTNVVRVIQSRLKRTKEVSIIKNNNKRKGYSSVAQPILQSTSDLDLTNITARINSKASD